MLQAKPGIGIGAPKTPSPMLVRGGDALRAGGGDDERHLDRTRRAVAVGMEHLQDAALPLDLLAAQQRPQDAHVRRSRRPLHRALAHREAGP